MAKGQFKMQQNINNIDYSGSEIVEIGRIIDTTTGKEVMFIYYDKDMYIKRGFHICIDEYSLDDGDYPVAMTDDLHRPCFYDHPEIFLTIMLHELGHYRNGDLQIENTNQEKIQEERLNAIISGRVQEQERKADAFAAQHVGKNTFMRTMDYMIRKRKERGDEGMGLAIREFELRKKAIQNMKI